MGVGRRSSARASIAATILLASCSGHTKAAPLPPPPSNIRVRMVDYKFIYSAPTRPGRAVFTVTNAGKVDHHLTLIPLSDDLPPIDEQLHGTTRRSVNPEAQSPTLRPGESEAFAVDLVPGQRYALICFLRDRGDPVNHALKGMNAEFRDPRGPGPRN